MTYRRGWIVEIAAPSKLLITKPLLQESATCFVFLTPTPMEHPAGVREIRKRLRSHLQTRVE